MGAKGRATIKVSGRVQGVGYRYFAEMVAQKLDLTGYVQNVLDGDVETVVEGPKADIEKYIVQLRQGPPMASVDDVTVAWENYLGDLKSFSIQF